MFPRAKRGQNTREREYFTEETHPGLLHLQYLRFFFPLLRFRDIKRVGSRSKAKRGNFGCSRTCCSAKTTEGADLVEFRSDNKADQELSAPLLFSTSSPSPWLRGNRFWNQVTKRKHPRPTKKNIYTYIYLKFWHTVQKLSVPTRQLEGQSVGSSQETNGST